MASVLSGEIGSAAEALAAVGRAAGTDWRAAAWWLEHHPSTSDQFSEAAVSDRIRRATVSQCLEALEAAGLSPADERVVLLQMQARGLGAHRWEAE